MTAIVITHLGIYQTWQKPACAYLCLQCQFDIRPSGFSDFVSSVYFMGRYGQTIILG